MRTSIITAIALFMPSIGYCQSELVPVIVSGQTWYAMPFERLSKITNELEFLRREVTLLEYTEAALLECKELSVAKGKENAALREFGANLEAEISQMQITIENRRKALVVSERLTDTYRLQAEFLEQENKKIRLGRGVAWAVGGGVSLGLGGLLIWALVK
jgi:hypothetical protein